MKKYIYSVALLFATTFFFSCSDSEAIVNNGNNIENKGTTGVRVSLDLNGNLSNSKSNSKSRIGFTTDNTGFPKPKQYKENDLVDVVCIFKSTDNTQPITKVQTKWKVNSDGSLSLNHKNPFEMTDKTDLNKGDWYVMGVIGGTLSADKNSIDIKGYKGNVKPDEEISDADVPFVFGWRKLSADANKKHLRSTRTVNFMPLGTFVWVKVTNKLGWRMKYNGARVISSSPFLDH